MTRLVKIGSSRFVRTSLVFCFLVLELLLAASPSSAAEQTIGPLPSKTQQTLAPPPSGIQAFHPGEILTYDVSWSSMFSAGTVTIQRSTVNGVGYSLYNNSAYTVRIGGSQLVGPISKTLGSVVCAGVYTATFGTLNSTCD